MNDKEALQLWIDGRDLERGEVEELFGRLMDGALSEVYKAALLSAIRRNASAALWLSRT